MNPRDALLQLATVCGGITGIAQASYPATDIEEVPALNLYWDETEITHMMQEQVWVITVRGQLLVALVTDADADKSAADALLAPIVDKFAPGTPGWSLTVGGERADFCEVRTLRPSQTIGGYYGAEVIFRMKLWRAAGS